MSTVNKQSIISRFFLDVWYNKRWWAWLLMPLSLCYFFASQFYFRQSKRRSTTIRVPVVIVGNITVGGTGKTPIIMALAKLLQQRGVNVGIVSRGYRSQAPYYPYLINSDESTTTICGDEPLLLAKNLNCPVIIDKNRVAAAQTLLDKKPDIQIILSDDGLQHYKLNRTAEVVVVDAQRGLGNHLCLPAGPLREPASRLASVDWILRHHKSSVKSVKSSSTDTNKASQKLFDIQLKPVAWRNIQTWETQPLHPLPWSQEKGDVIAVAGIANPQSFFNILYFLNVDHKPHEYDDHYSFSQEDIVQWGNDIVVMTEKDAVKCQPLLKQQAWALVVESTLPNSFVDNIYKLVQNENC